MCTNIVEHIYRIDTVNYILSFFADKRSAYVHFVFSTLHYHT